MIPKRPVFASLLLILAIQILAPGSEEVPSSMPSPELLPAQVVEIQLAALQFNDRPIRDAGIAAAFRFASPENRKVTGPVARFAQIVRAPGYAALIDHRVAGYGVLVVQGDLAVRRVTVVAADGRASEFEFRLSKDPASGCWYTDGVIPIPDQAQAQPGKIAMNAHPALIL